MWPSVLALLLPALAHAGEERNPFRVEARDARASAGDTATVEVLLVVPPKHHVFRDMVQVTVTDAAGLAAGSIDYPPGVMAPDTTGTNGGQPRESYEQDAVVRVPLVVPAGAPAGRRDVGLHVRYQGCSDKLCFFPQEEDLQATVDVLGASATSPRPAPAASAGPPPPLPVPAGGTSPSRGCAHAPEPVSLSAVASLLAVIAARVARRGASR
jgi:thiol:disulfide interchange protein DsbD